MAVASDDRVGVGFSRGLRPAIIGRVTMAAGSTMVQTRATWLTAASAVASSKPPPKANR
jgi:hypothetical protein